MGFQSEVIDGPRNITVWYRLGDRIRARMEEIAGRVIEQFTPHDLSRTARSNIKQLGVDYETAEAMLNHAKKDWNEPTIFMIWKKKKDYGS